MSHDKTIADWNFPATKNPRMGRCHIQIRVAALIRMPADEIEDGAIEELGPFPVGRMSGLGDDHDLVVGDVPRNHARDRRRRRRVGCASHQQCR